jgi:hypothetical protein
MNLHTFTSKSCSSFLRLFSHLLPFLTFCFLIFTSVSSWGAFECGDLFNRFSSRVDSYGLEYLKNQASYVKNFNQLVNLTSKFYGEHLRENEMVEILRQIPQLPRFIPIEKLVHEIAISSRKVTHEFLEAKIIGAGADWVKEHNSADEIMVGDFIPQKMKFYMIDIGGLKRERPDNISPIEQSFIWEAEDNDEEENRRASVQIPFELRTLSKNQVHIATIDGIEHLPQWIASKFFRGDRVLIPNNPLNTSPKAPFLNAQPTGESMPLYLTASRVGVDKVDDSHAFAVKVATNYTSPSNYLQRAEGKADLREDVFQSILRSRYVRDRDREIGQDSRLKILLEVLAVSEKNTANGFIVRDLTPITDSLYVPGTAIRSVTQKIGQKQMIAALWKSAANQGVAQALLLLRYGFQCQYPHRQNSLEKMNSDYSIAETTVFRDMTEMQLVGPAAAILAPELIMKDREHKIKILEENYPNTQYVDMLENKIDPTLLLALERRLIDSYWKTISEELGIPPKVYAHDPIFLEALKKYHERLRLQNSGH